MKVGKRDTLETLGQRTRNGARSLTIITHLLLVVTCLSGCALDTRSSGNPAAPSSKPDVPPEESGPVPAIINSFLRDSKEDFKIIVYRLGVFGTSSSDTFHRMPILQTRELDSPTRGEVADILMLSTTYSTSHIGCVGAGGIGLSLRSPNRQVDLIVDLTCDHLFDAETREEIGFLSRYGEMRLRMRL